MIKVGILSMQRIINYGSFLQAYGLKSIIEELGCQVEFVDYHPGECLIKDKRQKHGIFRKIEKAFKVLTSGAPIRQSFAFIKFKRNFGAKYFNLLGITNTKNYSPNIDLLVIGSDEVFNCVQDNENVGFTLELFGAENNAKRLVSYAASFGNSTLIKLKNCNVTEKISEMLLKFDALSVRDSNSFNIINSLTGIEPYIHLDPVLIYDFIEKCKNIPDKVAYKNYIVLYGYSNRFSKNECRTIRKYAKRKNLKVLCFGGVQRVCDKFIDCSPFELFAYFKNAESIITDTFHGTILSIIAKNNFAVFVRSCGYGNSEKITDLLNFFKLNNHIVEDLALLDDKLSTPIDYNSVDNLLAKERENTFKYLKDNVKKVEL